MHPKTPHAVKRRASPVTLIIGIKCKDGVVLASDSQITYGTTKRSDGAKMETVFFLNFPVIVGQSGDVILSNRFVDIFDGLSKTMPCPENPMAVGNIATQAMRTLRLEQRDVHFGCTSEELTEIFRKQGVECGIMIGFFMNGESHIFSIDIHKATAQKSRAYYEADGCGAPLGLYFLKEYSEPQMDIKSASILAIYIIEQAKNHDTMCGGDTKVGVLREDDSMPCVGNYNQDAINKCSALLVKSDAATKSERLKMFREKIAGEDFKAIEIIYLD